MLHIPWIPLFAMLVSLMAMLIQLVFGMLAQKRAEAETDRQIAETKKQEKLHILDAEETYKREVREWGRSVVKSMAYAQQLCKTDPTTFVTSDYALECGATVAKLRGALDMAKWLFPNLAVPSREDAEWNADSQRQLSALETILHAYHVLDTVKAGDGKSRDRAVKNLRNLRKRFVSEMRAAVDPHVRGEDIENLIAEVKEEIQTEKQDQTNPDKMERDSAAKSPRRTDRDLGNAPVFRK